LAIVIETCGSIPGQPGSGESAAGGRLSRVAAAQLFLAVGDFGFQLPVLALLERAGGSVDGVKLSAISLSRSRRDSPTPANTWAHASRSFSSAVAAIPEIISRDW